MNRSKNQNFHFCIQKIIFDNFSMFLDKYFLWYLWVPSRKYTSIGIINELLDVLHLFYHQLKYSPRYVQIRWKIIQHFTVKELHVIMRAKIGIFHDDFYLWGSISRWKNNFFDYFKNVWKYTNIEKPKSGAFCAHITY